MAARPKVPAYIMGDPPDPAKVQPYPGIPTYHNPSEALRMYRCAIMKEREAFNSRASKDWFREHRKKKREEAKLSELIDRWRSRSNPPAAADSNASRPVSGLSRTSLSRASSSSALHS
mmetsp:Transcript_102837/g.299994  ORF Transcript_102837/g.299994 Transcript_102837/m.299994 type:complete len:118 (+) Transcript_102837:57-410(+)